MEELIRNIAANKVIAIVRGVQKEKMEPLFKALFDGGIRNIEITLNTEDALKSIEDMKKAFGSQMNIGAGTVLNENLAKEAINAGAQFLVSPNVDKGMISAAIEAKVLPIPGALTPTEIAQALSYGAELIKLFPSSTMGPKYIKELRGPFDKLKIIAVGGISLENAAEYIRSGAVGIGVGGQLVNKKLIEEENFRSITEYAEKLIQVSNS